MKNITLHFKKKSLCTSIILGALVLTGCESELVNTSTVIDSEEVKTEVIDKNIKLPLVTSEIKKIPTNTSFSKEKKDLLSEVSGAKEKLKLSIIDASEKGLIFEFISKEKLESLSEFKKDEYNIKLAGVNKPVLLLETYISDKYYGSDKQNFFLSKVLIANDVGYVESKYDDQSTEDFFLIKVGNDWAVFESKEEKEKRLNKIKLFLQSK
jgi:hypothetical protein